jgi:hypothetical protein
MPIIIVLACGTAIYAFSVFYALYKGYDVKAALKIPFIALTFEARGHRGSNPTKSGTPDR